MRDLKVMRGIRTSLAAAAMLAGFGMGSAALAAVCPTITGVYSPSAGSIDIERQGDLNTSGAPVCFAFGAGNPTQGSDDYLLNGVEGPLGPPPGSLFYDPSYGGIKYSSSTDPALEFIEDVDDGSGTYISFTGGGTTSGTFSVDSVVSGYEWLITAFKVGGGTADPDWFAWIIPNVIATYDWSITNLDGATGGGLSGVGLYGAVPLPAAAWLMLAAVGGLGFVSRRRKAGNA